MSFSGNKPINDVILYDSEGNTISVRDGYTVSSYPSAIPIAGSDGANYRLITLKNSNPSGNEYGIVVRNISNGTQTVSGTVTSNQGTANTIQNAWSVKVTNSTNILDIDSSGRISLQSAGSDGTPVPGKVLQVGGKDTVGNLQSIAVDTMGRIITAPASATSSSSGFSFGTAISSSATTIPLRTTAYTEQTTNGQRSFKSASTSDTSAGVGARQVKITYYDQTLAGPFNETVTLNGTTAVNTVATNICFVEKLEVVSTGSGGANAGIITLYSQTAGLGTVIGTIGTGNVIVGSGDNKTLWSHHYIANGVTCYITAQWCCVGKNTQNGTFFLRMGRPTISGTPETVVSEILRGAGNAPPTLRVYPTPIQIVGPARIIQYVTPDGTQNVTNYGSFDYYEQ